MVCRDHLQILSQTGESSKAPRTKFALGKNWTKSSKINNLLFESIILSLTNASDLRSNSVLRVHSFQCG